MRASINQRRLLVVLALRPPSAHLLHHAAADRVGRRELEAAVLRVERLAGYLRSPSSTSWRKNTSPAYSHHDVGAVARRIARVDDDHAAIGELGLHAVPEHAQGVGLERAAVALSHRRRRASSGGRGPPHGAPGSSA